MLSPLPATFSAPAPLLAGGELRFLQYGTLRNQCMVGNAKFALHSHASSISGKPLQIHHHHRGSYAEERKGKPLTASGKACAMILSSVLGKSTSTRLQCGIHDAAFANLRGRSCELDQMMVPSTDSKPLFSLSISKSSSSVVRLEATLQRAGLLVSA